MLDPNTVAFASGNYINFLDAETKIMVFRRTTLGGGIGNIRVSRKPNELRILHILSK